MQDLLNRKHSINNKHS